MPGDKTILGIDYGLARVGVALGHTETKLASSLVTLPNNQSLITELRTLCEREAVSAIVVGLPRGLESNDTEQTHISTDFAKQLKQLDLPVHMRDEAGTTELALERLNGHEPKAGLDAEAAAIILQDYLNEK